MQNKKTKLIVINAIVAALYVVVTSLTAFMSFGNIQFRIAEMLNHLFALTEIRNRCGCRCITCQLSIYVSVWSRLARL